LNEEVVTRKKAVADLQAFRDHHNKAGEDPEKIALRFVIVWNQAWLKLVQILSILFFTDKLLDV
jgi:hypothetical protein